jgi:hypothetical protein
MHRAYGSLLDGKNLEEEDGRMRKPGEQSIETEVGISPSSAFMYIKSVKVHIL